MQEELNAMTHDPNTPAARLATLGASQAVPQRLAPSPAKRPILRLPAMMVPPEVADPGLIRIGAAVGQRPRHG